MPHKFLWGRRQVGLVVEEDAETMDHVTAILQNLM